jgi:hypothetical protein
MMKLVFAVQPPSLEVIPDTGPMVSLLFLNLNFNTGACVSHEEGWSDIEYICYMETLPRLEDSDISLHIIHVILQE